MDEPDSHRNSKFLAKAIVFALAVGLATPSAYAQAVFHNFSIAGESTPGRGTFTGERLTRAVFNVQAGRFPPHSWMCFIPWGLPQGQHFPVYTTQWVYMADGHYAWIELGSAYNCSTERFQFWGYYTASGGFVGWYEVNPALGNYTYAIERRAGNLWDYKIGGVTYDTIVWTGSGVYVDAGLESWDDLATARSLGIRVPGRIGPVATDNWCKRGCVAAGTATHHGSRESRHAEAAVG